VIAFSRGTGWSLSEIRRLTTHDYLLWVKAFNALYSEGS